MPCCSAARFNRRGLIQNLAAALSCSVADLTGQPYHFLDRQSTDVDVAVAEIITALHDTTLDDVPDIPMGPLPELARASSLAHAQIVPPSTAWPRVAPPNSSSGCMSRS